MDFKLLKLNLKMAWFKLSGRVSHSDQIINFSSKKIKSPKVLIVFPIKEHHASAAIKYVYDVIDIFSEDDAEFSLIINSSYKNSIKLYNISVYTFNANKNGRVTNLGEIINQIYLNKYDIIIDMNVKFNIEIAMLINELSSNYKIGFSSDFSDLFYNIQLKHNKNNNGYKAIKNILS